MKTAKPKIKLLRHAQYGRERFYPGCPLSTAICLIKEGKTVSDTEFGILRDIGKCEIEVVDVEKRPKDGDHD